jgi:hypothetical protein
MKTLLACLLLSTLCGCATLVTQDRVSEVSKELNLKSPVRVIAMDGFVRGLYVSYGPAVVLLEDNVVTLRHEMFHHKQYENNRPFDEGEADRFAKYGVQPSWCRDIEDGR